MCLRAALISLAVGGSLGRNARVTRPAPSGSETATVLVAGGYSYLVLERLAKPFSQALRRTTDAVTASFRPARKPSVGMGKPMGKENVGGTSGRCSSPSAPSP